MNKQANVRFQRIMGHARELCVLCKTFLGIENMEKIHVNLILENYLFDCRTVHPLISEMVGTNPLSYM